MAGASMLTTLLEYPGSPVHQAVPTLHQRLIILGAGMGFVVAGIVYFPWGKRSGAHINRLNPARAFGSAVAAHTWKAMSVYVFGPILGTLLAERVYRHWQGCYFAGPRYPVKPFTRSHPSQPR